MPTRQLELPFTAPRQPLGPPRVLPGSPLSPLSPVSPGSPRTPGYRPVGAAPVTASWRTRAAALPPPSSILLRPPEAPAS
jgi:hypothetical protein